MGDHDCGYKKLFSFPIMVEDLLRGFVKQKWVAELDFSTLERHADSYVTDDLREREDDIIWRVKWRKQNEWMYIYLLIEFQTTPDPFMAVRIANYLTLLYQDLIDHQRLTAKDRLPPVLPMVLYRGDRRWRAPLDIKSLIRKPPPGLSRYLPSQRYLLLEEVRMRDEDLEKMCNLVADIFRIEKSNGLKAIIPPLASLWAWAQRAGPQQDSLRRAVKAWFSRAQMPVKIIDEDDAIEWMDIEEIEPMLSERIEKELNEIRSKSRSEGIREGLAEGSAAILLMQLKNKFGTVSKETEARIASASPEALLEMSIKVLNAGSPEDIF